MQTQFNPDYLSSSKGQQADSILRSCVHCGFCTATCPTYLLTGNELDSPRGRIYLIKTMLEGAPVSKVTQTHLDRCLTCQSCETTCPSNVDYHSLLSIGRAHMESATKRSMFLNLKRWLIRKSLQSKTIFGFLIKTGRIFKFMLPQSIKQNIPDKVETPWPETEHPRRMLILNGCVQNSMSPNTNAAAARVLNKLGIQLVTDESEGCCGALAYHMNEQEEGLQKARYLIDTLYERLENDVEAVISSASGCGNFIQDYAKLLADDEAYALKAKAVRERTYDLSQILADEDLGKLNLKRSKKLAFHCPCTLQHGLGLGEQTPKILEELGFDLSPVKDSHLCCGSAGTYSIFQPAMSQQLKANKLAALDANNPDAIATANIGCQYHLGGEHSKEVRHWIEFVDEGLASSANE